MWSFIYVVRNTLREAPGSKICCGTSRAAGAACVLHSWSAKQDRGQSIPAQEVRGIAAPHRQHKWTWLMQMIVERQKLLRHYCPGISYNVLHIGMWRPLSSNCPCLTGHWVHVRKPLVRLASSSAAVFGRSIKTSQNQRMNLWRNFMVPVS